MTEPSSRCTGSPAVYEPAQNGNGWRVERIAESFGSTLTTIPADNGALHPVTNEGQERGNPVEALRASVLSRQSAACLDAGGIASEANALGKAEGYADGGTTLWMVEVQVGVKKS